MIATTTQLADSQHPWIGLSSFTEGDSAFFAGRGEEIDELLRLVRRDTLTLLYGVSGLGKTSLLQAGLFPALRIEEVLPVPIRLDFLEGAPPLTRQVLGAISAAARAAMVEAPESRPDETLWEYFHREGNHFWGPRNDLVTPFLVFDQFEEFFTLGRETPERARRASEFISELADLVENRPPAALRDDPQRAREFSFKPASLKVLLAMREDYLADLDRIRSQFRALGQNRLRLLPMGERQARQVIDLGAELLAPGVADRIVMFAAGGAATGDGAEIAVAPALLSLVLRELNERRLARGPDAKITADLLDVEQQKILDDFYVRTLQDFPLGVRNFIEDELLTATGYRNSCALDDALSRQDVTQLILDELVNRRLLAYEDRHRVRRVEITHDVLAPVIKASRDTRLTREALAKAERQKLEAREKERATRRRFAVVVAWLVLSVALLVLSIAMALWGWRANIKGTNLLHDASQADVDSAAEVSEVSPEDWKKPLTFFERAARNWPGNPDVAPSLWAQLRHGAASRAPLLIWSHPISEDSKLAWNPEGNLIATVSQTQPVQLWEAESGTLLWDSEKPNLKLSGTKGDVHFSSDGEKIILRRSKDLWSVISVEQRKLIFESESHELLNGEPISPNGKQAVSRGADASVRIISTLADQPAIPLVGSPPHGGMATWSPKGDRVAVSFDPKTAAPGVDKQPRSIHIYDALSGEPQAAIQPSRDLSEFWFNSSGEYLLVKSDMEWPSWFEIWQTDKPEAALIETKQATFAKWFHKDEKKLLWNIPIKAPTSPGATRENHSVVHTVGADEKDDIPLLLSDLSDADISDDDSVSVVLRDGESREGESYQYYQVFNLKTGRASTSTSKLGSAFTGFLSPNSRRFALSEEKSGENTAQSRWDLSRWDFGSSQQTWHPSDTKRQKNIASPKWDVSFRGSFVLIQSNGTPSRTICSIPLEERPRVYEWINGDRKLRVFARNRQYTDIEWDTPEAIEEPILRLVRCVIGQRFDESRKMGGKMVPIPDEERIGLRKELETAKVKDPRWQKLLDWWNEERPGD